MENHQQPSSKQTRSHSPAPENPTKTIKNDSIDTPHTQISQPTQDDEESKHQPNSNTTTSDRLKDSTTPEEGPSSSETDPQSELKPVVYANGDWEAVYDPQTNAYYFANSKTGETTWTNPLVPSEPNTSSRTAPQTTPDLGGIDPELAHLDPQIARILHGHASQTEPRFVARFNAKTGRFEADPTRDPSRVSEYARARSQAEAFFDVAGWEKTLEKHNGSIPGTSKETRTTAIEQGKKLSKAQLNQFKQQKMEKKARNQRAWLM